MANTRDDRSYVTTPQAAERTGFSKTYLTRLLRNGILEGFRLGRDWLIYTDSLDRYLAVPHKPGPKGPRKKRAPSHTQLQEVSRVRNNNKGESGKLKDRY